MWHDPRIAAIRCSPLPSWPCLPLTLAEPIPPLYFAAQTPLLFKQAMALSRQSLVPKILCSRSPLDIPMMRSLLFPLNSPMMSSSLSSLKSSPYLHPLPLPPTGNAKINIPGQDLLPDFSKSLLHYLHDPKVLSYKVSGTSLPLLLTCRFLPTVSPSVWPPRLRCMFHSSSLLNTPVRQRQRGASAGAKLSESRQTALFMGGYLNLN